MNRLRMLGLLLLLIAFAVLTRWAITRCGPDSPRFTLGHQLLWGCQ